MNRSQKRIALIALLVAAGGLMHTLTIRGGSLDPAAPPAPTMKSLGDIYNAVAPSPTADPLPLPKASRVEGTDFVHLSLRGATQGDIHGSCRFKGRDGTIVVEEFVHGVVSPRDAASGLPTGKRQHKPITITKRIDRSTPLLYNVLVNNENLPEVTFRFYRTGRDGLIEQYYTVQLVNASIAGVESAGRDTENISFCYQNIIWTWTDGGITAEDDWESPVV
jgi:type VI secretion system secreted protein Hcp